MLKQIPRSTWLLLLAAGNLVVWTAIAVAVGLVASDVVDLGLETFVRDTQVTAVAAWEQVSSAGAGRDVSDPDSGSEGAEALEEMEATTTPEMVWPDAVAALTPQSDSSASRSSDTGSSQQPAAPAGEAQPEATATLVASPLLLADPDMSNVEEFTVEMNRSALGRAVQIRLSEGGLNQEVTVLLANDPNLPYRNVQIDLNPGYAVVSATVTVLGFQVRTVVEGTVIAEDCLPVVEVQSVSMGGVFTPQFVEDAIEEMIAEAMTWYPSDFPMCLEQIVLEEDRATVYGHRR